MMLVAIATCVGALSDPKRGPHVEMWKSLPTSYTATVDLAACLMGMVDSSGCTNSSEVKYFDGTTSREAKKKYSGTDMRRELVTGDPPYPYEYEWTEVDDRARECTSQPHMGGVITDWQFLMLPTTTDAGMVRCPGTSWSAAKECRLFHGPIEAKIVSNARLWLHKVDDKWVPQLLVETNYHKQRVYYIQYRSVVGGRPDPNMFLIPRACSSPDKPEDGFVQGAVQLEDRGGEWFA